MKRLVVSLFILTISFITFGCTTNTIVDPVGQLRLKEQNYSISGETTGEKTVTRVLVFFPLIWDAGFTSEESMPWYAPLTEIAKEGAMYDALGKLKNADMITAPKYTIENNNYLLFQTVTVTVKCRGIQLSR